MQVTREGRAITWAFEGCHKLVPGSNPRVYASYYCPAGVLTIGVGHTNHHDPKFKAGDVWPESKCDAVLTSDLRTFEVHVEKLCQGKILTPAQNDALVDWSFNTGGPATSAVWKYVRAGDVEGTCERLSRWINGGGKVLPGLVRRRKANCQQYRGDVRGAMRTADARVVATEGETTGRADRSIPQPSAGEVAKRTKTQTGTIAAGGAGEAGTATVPEKTATHYGLITVFAVVILVGVVLLIRKVKFIKEDWA